MSGTYQQLNMDDTEKDKLLPSEKGGVECCSPTRFTIITLSGLVCLLTAALFCLIRYPIASESSGNVGRAGPAVLKHSTEDTLIGLISDIHLDPNPRACVGEFEFGVFGCDSTLELLNVTLEDMARNMLGSEDQALLMLGDAALHQREASWDSTVTLDSIVTVFEQFEDHFPDTPVFPTIGNNDLPAHNSIPEISWYSSLLEYFEAALKRGGRVTLPSNFREIFMYGGYYSATFADKFTVISLNTNLFSAKVPDRNTQKGYAVSHLQWLNETLENLEGEAVIIGHHPLTLSLYALYQKKAAQVSWRLEYFEVFREIFNRHHGKIIGMFFGHEHQDTFVVERSSGVNMASFTFPSLSPIYSGQPSYGVARLGESESDGKKNFKDIFTFHTWLDYYTRLDSKPKFLTYRSFGQILGVKELSFDNLSEKSELNIEDSDGLKTFIALKDKIYQERYVPKLSPHLFYCYTTNFTIAAFIQCVEKFGYSGKPFIVNS